MNETFVDRLVKERDELQERLTNLDKFIMSEECRHKLKLAERIMLEEQSNAMAKYLNILTVRLHFYGK